jgi:hypothetical protein
MVRATCSNQTGNAESGAVHRVMFGTVRRFQNSACLSVEGSEGKARA